MLLELVVGLAAIFQYTAAILALRVLRVTGRAPVWLLIAAVAFLMAVRRTIVLCRSMVQGAEYRPDLAVECVGLAISIIMVVGVARIGPFFLSILESREELRKRTQDLRKRVKELNLFFGMSRLVETPDISFEGIIQGIVDLGPRSWQYPEVACSRIVIGDEVFATQNFKETIWQQGSEIRVGGRAIGRVEICYLEEKPPSDEGPFLEEERRLIDAVAELLGEIVEREQAQEQVRRHQAELAHVSRVSTMGGMASGLAHELNQPLCAISSWLEGCIDMIRSGSAQPDELLRAMEVAAEQTTRASDIIEHLREFMGKQEPRRELLDVSKIVRRAMSIVVAEAKREGVVVRLELADRRLPVMADAVQVEQVVLNLVRNSLDAMSEKQTGRRELTIRTAITEGGEVEVAISDTAGGLSPEVADRMFEPFFTTKPEGMGLGLSISQSLVEAHGGRLSATPSKTEGTTFRLSLPMVKENRSDED